MVLAVKRAALLSAVLLFVLGNSLAQAQLTGVIDQVRAQKAGLKVEWISQVQVDPTAAKLSGIYLQVSDKNSTTTFELTYGKQREVISQFDFGPDGRQFGVEGAKEWAELRQEILKEGRGIDAKIEKFVTPKTMLYATTTEGVVQAIDGTTGKTIWSTTVGNRKFHTTGPSANEEFVTIVNGSSIYCLRADTGKPLWNHTCRAAPGAAPAMSDDFAFVPLLNGFVEAFPLFDPTAVVDKRKQVSLESPEETKTEAQLAREKTIKEERISRYGRVNNRVSKHMSMNYFVSAGAATDPPIVTGLTTSWPTLRGHYNVGYNSRDKVGKMIFRLKTGGPIVAPGAERNQILFVASTDGFVYAVDERDGTLQWNFGTGEPISQTPIPIGDSVYAISNDFGMFKINIKTGEADENWPSRLDNIKSFVAASRDKIYVIDNLNRLVAIQQKTGAIVSRVAARGQDFQHYNLKTDRIYIGTKTGTIQCLREIGQNHPIIHSAEQMDDGKTDGGQKKPDDGKGEKNPFDEKGEKNPFDEKKEEKNPFDG